MGPTAANRFINRAYDFWLRFTFPIFGLLAIASGGGVFFKGLYRDTMYYKVMAAGQDFFSLAIVAPTLLITPLLAHRGSLRALFVWLGIVIYLIYTYAIAAFHNQFSALFLVYVALFGCSMYALIGVFLSLNKDAIKTRFTERTPVRAVSLYHGALGVLFIAALTLGVGLLIWYIRSFERVRIAAVDADEIERCG